MQVRLTECRFDSGPGHVKAFVEKMGRRIELQTTEPFPALENQIPGAYWRDKAKRWSLPLGMAVCRNIREVFGPQLEIGPKLSEWARAEIALEVQQRATGRNLGKIPIPRVEAAAPALAKAILSRPYQTAGARFIADGQGVLVADTPGLGKTTETIAGVVESGVAGPYLVAAPVAAITGAWERELQTRLGDGARIFTITGTKGQRQKALAEALRPDRPQDVTWIVVNIEMLRTKVWWICPECEAMNAGYRAERDLLKPAWEEAMALYETLHESWKLLGGQEPIQPEEPKLRLVQDRWEASDRPKAGIVDCGHNPNRVRTFKEHQFPELFDRPWGALIMDECQRILLRNTGKSTQTRKGAMLLESAPDGLRIALSGTPMRGKPHRLWGVLNWLRRDVFSGFWSWVERFFWVDTTGYGGARVIKSFREDRREAFEADLDRYMLRRTQKEVRPDLPAKAYMGTPLDPKDPDSPTAVWLDMLPEQERAYREMLSTSSAKVDGGSLQAVGILAEIVRLKQFASSYGQLINDGDFRPHLPSNKVDWIEQFLLERNILTDDADEEPTGKVIIVSQFTSLLKMLASQLYAKHGLLYSRVTGSVTGVERQRQIDRFNDPDSGIQVMFLNTLAGGVALTLDVADDMVFLDETHVPDDQEQAEGRNDNRRPEEKVVQRRYWYLKSLGSIDEAIARTNAHRDKDQKQHLDGRRGVEYAREVFATMRELIEGKGKR